MGMAGKFHVEEDVEAAMGVRKMVPRDLVG